MVRFKIFLLLVILPSSVYAQSGKRNKSSMRDTLDGAFDMSDFLIEAHGFIPLPFIVTEPAFGGFGGGFAPIFLKKRPAQVDIVDGKERRKPTPPDITGGGGIYTINNSWVLMAFRSGTWMRARSKYRIATGYADLNLSYYRTIAGEEHEYEFNFRTIPLTGYLIRQIGHSSWSAGIQYLLLHTDVEPLSDNLPAFVRNKEIESTVSMPSLAVDFENRDNIFTPDKGVRMHATMGWSDEAFGSDYDYWNFNLYFYGYYPLRKNLIGGLRYEVQQVSDDAPFYLLPYLDIRGVPVARYQGNIFSVMEGELRWDVVTRWSAVFFGGTGKAYNAWDEFDESDWIVSGGAGFRYLIARKFKLRMGLDLARSPDQWAYYIVFGSSWLK